VVIDKLDKIGAEAVIEQLASPAQGIGLSPEQAREVVAGLAPHGLEEAAARAPAGSAGAADLRRLFELLEAYGLSDRVAFDPSVVRGLAYYTGIVFEGFDARGELRAVCGGGRYDRLAEQLGGPPIPAAGFGLGDVVVLELLADLGLLPGLPRALDAVVVAVSEAERPAAVRAARRLREAGRAVELVLGTPRLKRVLQDADKSGTREVWVVGPDEAARGVARVRDLATGAQRDEPLPA
jgi:histidyl-tRNA synthetase